MSEQMPEFLTKSVQFLDDKKAESIAVLDLRERPILPIILWWPPPQMPRT